MKKEKNWARLLPYATGLVPGVAFAERDLAAETRFLRADLLPKLSQADLGKAPEEGSEGALGMKRTRFSEEQMVGAVKQVEAGRGVPELARALGVSDQTLYNWKAKYGGMEASEEPATAPGRC